jgi:hypothetical protein
MSRNQHRDRTSKSKTRTSLGRVRVKANNVRTKQPISLREPDGISWVPFIAPHTFLDIDPATLALDGEDGSFEIEGDLQEHVSVDIRYYGLTCAGWHLDQSI